MIQSDEIVSPDEDLNSQIEINEDQLRQLYAILKADRLNLVLWSLLFLIMFFCFSVLLVAFVFPNFGFKLRPELYQFSGILAVLSFYAIIQIIRSLYIAWVRFGEITMAVKHQEKAISYAEKVLDKPY